jgi:hypothetical protein
VAFLFGTIVNGVAAGWFARGVLPRFSFRSSIRASVAGTLACLLLGVMLASATDEIAATFCAAIALFALALFAERDEARALPRHCCVSERRALWPTQVGRRLDGIDKATVRGRA